MGSLYFYDLETSGFSPSDQRVLQFAGQRTDMQLRTQGQPHNFLITLNEDVLPDPEAILINGITPQQTRAEGITETEFLIIFEKEIATRETIFTGYNTVRFDDEFMRYMHYRNFYDPYEWQWQDGRSKWDLLDTVRMTRALRPEGIKWPFNSDGRSSNGLGLLSAINGLDHADAHDALSDVQATIALGQLLYAKQPKLFNYLLGIRDKKSVAGLVMAGKPFVYTSGKYPSQYEKTTVVAVAAKNPDKQSAMVFDLRYNPEEFAKFTPKELAEGMSWHKPGTDTVVVPVKTMKFNRCPAVAPLSVLDKKSKVRLGIDTKLIDKHFELLNAMTDFQNKLLKAVEILDEKQQARLFADERSVDAQLYDNFYAYADKKALAGVRAAKPSELSSVTKSFKDQRLANLLPLYKARNFGNSLSIEERKAWDKFKAEKLLAGGEQSQMSKYFARIEELKQLPRTSKEHQYLLTELELYGQSLLPTF